MNEYKKGQDYREKGKKVKRNISQQTFWRSRFSVLKGGLIFKSFQSLRTRQSTLVYSLPHLTLFLHFCIKLQQNVKILYAPLRLEVAESLQEFICLFVSLKVKVCIFVCNFCWYTNVTENLYCQNILNSPNIQFSSQIFHQFSKMAATCFASVPFFPPQKISVVHFVCHQLYLLLDVSVIPQPLALFEVHWGKIGIHRHSYFL